MTENAKLEADGFPPYTNLYDPVQASRRIDGLLAELVKLQDRVSDLGLKVRAQELEISQLRRRVAMFEEDLRGRR